MANLSNINNKFLFTDGDFLKIGNLAPINNISGTESGISVTNGNCASITIDNSAASGKTFVIYSAVNGSLNFFDADAASGRLIIDSSGNSTFAGNITGVGATFVGIAASGTALVTIENNSGSTATSYGLLVVGGGNSSNGRTFEVRDASGNTDLIVKGNGNVGIGKTSPNYKLDIEGADLIRAYNPSGSASIQIKASANNNSSVDFADPDDTNVGQIIYRHADNSMSFDTDDTERMRILGDGSQIQIKGKFGGGADLLLYNTDVTLATNQMIGRLGFYKTDGSGSNVGVSSSIQVRATNSGAGSYMAFHTDGETPATQEAERMRIDSSGRVGIGTSDIEETLTIAKTDGGDGTIVGLRSDASFSQFEIATKNSQIDWGLQTLGARNMYFTTNGSERMRITSTGAISVGSTGAAYGTSGQVLISNGNTSPTWGSATSVSEDNYWKIDDGLNFHLAFKEGSGTTVADISGGRNNFTGTATWTETGKFGYALDFNGTNQNLGGTSPSSNITTFSAWINNDGGGGIQNIVSGSYIMGYVSIYNNDFQIYDGAGWRNGGAVPANEWVHVAFSYDAAGTSGGLQKMYVNGVLGYSATAVGYTGVASYISHVGVYAGAIRYFNGEITNIQTWDRILGDSEILSLYNQYSGNGGGGSSPFGQALKTYSSSANVVVATTVNASTVANLVSGHIIITASTGGGIITKTIGIYETSNLWFYDLATPEIENSNNSIVIAPSGNATNTLTFTVGVTNPVAGYGMTVSIQASPPGFFNL